MDSKQIYEGMTKGEWLIHDRAFCSVTSNGVDVIAACGTSSSNVEDLLPRQTANANAITSAVNGTYGVGIDPCKVKEMYDMLQNLTYLVKHDPKQTRTYKELTELLNAAKLTA